jgi:hypothetical protein
MHCPARGRRFIDRIGSFARPCARFTPSFLAAALLIQTYSVPRPPRGFYFHFREIQPVSYFFSRAGLTQLFRSCP